jgi:hypothetical protein
MFKRNVVIVLLVVLLTLSATMFTVLPGTHSRTASADDPVPTATPVVDDTGGGGSAPDGPECPCQTTPGAD